ncbi:MAG: 50S ribosomal protein L30e [Candidatus Bilamarchaeaceae archaeon]
MAEKDMEDEDVETDAPEETDEEDTTEEAVVTESVEGAPKIKREKKVVRKRKTKKEKENPMQREIRLAVETGKVEFGARSGLKNSSSGKAKLFVVAENTPAEIRGEVVRCAKAAEIPVLEFEGNTMELGSICGKPYPVSVLSVHDAGESDIIENAKKKK